MADGKKRKKAEDKKNRHFYGGITRLNKRLGELRGYISTQCTSEVDLSALLWLDDTSYFALALLYPMYRPPF